MPFDRSRQYYFFPTIQREYQPTQKKCLNKQRIFKHVAVLFTRWIRCKKINEETWIHRMLRLEKA
jgi:hypothetical protein